MKALSRKIKRLIIAGFAPAAGLCLSALLALVPPALGGPVLQGVGTYEYGTGSLSPAWPVHVAGDIGLLFVESTGGSAVTLSAPNGFTEITGSPVDTGTGGTRLTVFWARAVSGAMGAPTVADPGDHAVAVIAVFRGAIASGDPWDSTAAGTKTPASVTTSAGGVTTSVEDTLIVLGLTSERDAKGSFVASWTNSTLTGVTEAFDDGTNSGGGGGIAVMVGTHTAAGASGTTVVSLTSSENAYLTIALRRLTAPAINSLTVEATQITAAWPLISGAADYTLVAAAAAGDPPDQTYSATTAGSGTTVSSLSANTTYYIYSRSNGTGENSEWKLYRATSTLVEYPPASPTLSGITDSAAQISWSANGNPEGGNLYRVLVSTAPDPLNPAGAVVTSSETYGLSVSSSGLSSNTTYYFKVAGVNHNGVATAYASTAACTDARVPVSPLFDSVATDSAQFSWSANGNADGTKYRVQVSTADNMDAPSGAQVTSSDTYNLSLASSGLTYNTTYYFRVAAVNQGGVATAYTAASSTATAAAAPAFASFSGLGTGEVQFSWTSPNPPGTLYRVQASTASDIDSPAGAAVTTHDTYGLTLSSSGLAANTTYYFRAAAIGHGGSSSGYFSSESTATLANTPVFSAISGITSSEMAFSWTAYNPDGTLYRVRVSTAPDPLDAGSAAVTSSDTYNLSLTTSGLSANTTYYFRAAAVNRSGTVTGYSGAEGAAALTVVPFFSGFSVPSSGEVVLSWAANGNPGDTLYRVLASTVPDPLDPGLASVTSSDTYNLSLSSSGLDGNTTYYFRVAGVNRAGTLSSYTSAQATSTLAAVPSSFDFAGVAEDAMQFLWEDPGNAPGTLYHVQASTAPDLDSPAGAVVTSSDTYNLYLTTSGLTHSTEYFFRVAATNNNGIMSEYSAQASSTTLALGVLSAPISGAYSAFVSSISAAWTQVSGADNYTLAASVNPGTEPSPVNSSSDTLTDTELGAYVEGLAADTVYYLFVRANGPGDPSVWTPYSAVATLLEFSPDFDSFSGVGTNSADFAWASGGNPAGTLYRVVTSTAPDPLAPGSAVFSSSYTYNLSLSSAGLSANTTYYFRVAGVNKDNVFTDYTSVQSTATAAIAPVSAGFSEVTGGGMKFIWTAPGNPADTLYRVLSSTAPDPLAPAGAAVVSSDTYNTYLSSSGLAINTVYYFRVAAFNRAGVGTSYSTAAGTSTLAAAPSFQDFSGVTSAAAVFSWSAGGNPSGTLYRVLSSSSASPQPGGAGVVSSDTYNTSLSSAGLSSDRAYYFSVAALNHNGIATAYTSQESTRTLTEQPAFSSFSGLASSAIQFNWASGGNPAGTLYRAQVSLSEGGPAATSSDTYNTWLSSSGLSPSTTYYFRVAGINAAGSPTSYTADRGTATLAEVPAASDFTEVWVSSVQFNWSAPGNPAGTLYRAETLLSEAGEPVTSSDTYNFSLSSTGLTANTTYYFRASAVNVNGVPSEYSALKATSTLANIPAFDSFSNVAGSKIQFSWASNGNPLGTLYRVVVSTAADPLNPSGAEVKASETSDTFLYQTGLVSQTTYYFRVAAINNNRIYTGYTPAQSTCTLVSQASTLYFRTAGSALGGDALLMSRVRGSGTATYTRNTVSGQVTPPAPELQFTASPGSPVLYWYSYPVDEATISAPVTFNIWASESNFKGNAAITAELYRASAAGEILSTIASVTVRAELATSLSAQSWAVTPTPTALDNGDRLAAAWYIDDASGQTMVSGYSVNATLDGASASASGDSWLQVDNNLAPARPVTFSVTSVSTYSIGGTWELVEGATGYTMSASLESIVPPVTLEVSSETAGNSALLASNLDPNTTYHLFVHSDGYGNSSAYTLFTATSTLAAAPEFSAFTVPSSGQVDFSWSGGGNPAGTLYRVKSSTAADWESPAGAPVASSDTYSLSLSSSGLSANTTYYFWVAAVNHNGVRTSYSPAASTATLANTPAPDGFSSVGTSSADFGWTAGGNAPGTLYRVQSSTASDRESPGGAAVVSSDTYNLSLSSSGLSLNTTYYFWVTALNHNGVAAAYSASSSTSTLAAAPAFSSFAVPSSGQIDYSITSGGNPGGTLYRVKSSTAPDWQSPGGAAVVSSDTYNLSLSSSGLTANTTYYFWAAAINSNGVVTSYASAASTPTLANTPSPSAFASVGGSSMDFSWTANGNPDGTLYRVQSSTASDRESPGGAAVVSSDTYSLSLSSSGLSLNTTYYFWVTAVSRSGIAAAYSGGSSTSTLAAVPVFSAFTVPAQGQADISWTAGGNPPATLYRVKTSTAYDWQDPSGAAVASSDTYSMALSSTGLLDNTTYNFWLAAVNHNGVVTAYSSVKSTVTRADPPAFSVFSLVEGGQASAEWTSSNPPGTLYRVAVSTAPDPLSPGFASYTSSDVYSAQLTTSGLAYNTTYYFRAAAVSHAGIITDYSAAAGTSTLAAYPAALAFSGVSSHSVRAGWENPGNGPGTLYRLQVSTAPDLDAPAGAAVTSSDTYALYVDTAGLSYSTQYYFRAAALNNNGIMTAYSSAYSTTTLAQGTLSAPLAGAYEAFASSVSASWSLVSGANGYTLAASVNGGFEPSPIASSSETLSGTETGAYVEGLTPDTVYYLFARADDGSNHSAWTPYSAVATLLEFPPAFSSFSGVDTGAAVFSWTANGNAYPGTQFRVISSTAPDPLDPAGAVAVSSYTYGLSLSSSGLNANTTYYFTVAGVNKDGVQTDFDAVRATATAANAPAFSSFSGITDTAIQFIWSAPGNPQDTLYRVLTSTAADPLNPVGAAVSSSDTYNNHLSSSGLSANTTYYFRVAGVNRAGVTTVYTAAAGTSTLASAPVFQAFDSAGGSEISLSWTDNGNPGGTLYRVLASTAPDPAAPSGAAVSSSDTYSLSLSSSGLSYNTTYYFRVAGVNHNGLAGDFFSARSTPTLAEVPASGGFLSVESGTLQFSWTSQNPAGTLYRVWTSTAADPLSPAGAAATSSDTYNASLSTSGLSANTTYYFRAAAVSHAGVYTSYSGADSTSTLAAIPVFSAFTGVSSHTATFTWSAPANPPGTLYRVLASTAADPLDPGGAAVASSDTYNSSLSASALTSDLPYYFRAAALNRNGVLTSYSAAESTYTLTGEPASPGFAQVFASSVQFSWNAGDNPAGTLYRVLASTAADPLAPGGAAVTSSDTYNAYLSTSGLAADMPYYFRVAGVNGGGSPTAYTAAASTRTLTYVPQFASFSVATSSDIVVSWTANGNPGGTLYRVLVSTAADLLDPSGAAVTSSDTYNLSLSSGSLAPNTTYYFAAAGVNSDGSPSAYFGTRSTSTLANIPAFSGFSNVASARIQFNWTDNGNRPGTLYRVLASTVPDPLNPGAADVVETDTTDSFLFLTGLLSQTTYYFRAAAVNNDGILSGYSAARSTVTHTSVATTLYFRDAASALGGDYRLMTDSRGASVATYVKSTLAGPVTPPTAASEFTTYGGGPAAVWYSTPLDEVTIAGGVNFNLWAQESNAKANAAITAELYRTDSAGVVISTIASAVLDRTELTTGMTLQSWVQTPVSTTLDSGDRLAAAWYIDDSAGATMLTGYTVSASLDGPTASASGDAWVQVDETLAPARPAGFSVSAVSTYSITAGWTLVEGATGYNMASSLANTVPPETIVSSSETAADSAVLGTGLIPNTTYYLFARSNGLGSSSAWTQFTDTVTLANQPSTDTFSDVSAQNIKFSWTANNNPDGTRYRVKVSTAADPLAPGGAAVTTHDTYDLFLTTSGLTVGAEYYFRVAAVNHRGIPSGYTAAESTTTLAVYINEVYPSGASASEDWAELYNNTGAALSLEGWTLEYVQNTIALGGTPSTVWTGQAGDTIGPFSTFTVSGLSSDLNGAQSYHVRLVDDLSVLVGRVQWPALGSGQSFVRFPDGDPTYFEIDPTPTKGYLGVMSTDTFRLNEVAYGNLGGEFIEIYNTSSVSTATLAGYQLRNKYSSANGVVFRFTRVIYPLSYTVLDFSSVSDDGYTYQQVFGTEGLTAAGDFLALENSTGAVVDAVSWQSEGNEPRYDNRSAALALVGYAPANAQYSIVRVPAEGTDTDSDSDDFTSSSFGTLGSRYDGAGMAPDNALTYPPDNSGPQFLSRRFPISLSFAQDSGAGQANTLVFQRTGGSGDDHSPHTYRLADLGIDPSSLAAQTTEQYGPGFFDQDGYPLVSSASYRMFFNSDTGSAAADQIILDTVTYDASVHSVTASTASPVWMNNAARASMITLQVSNNSPAGFNGVSLSTVVFRLLDPDLVPMTQAQARSIFEAVMLARDVDGVEGVYEPGVDLSTAAYVPMASIEVDAAGYSTLTVSSQYLYETGVPAGSTSTFFVVFESTQDAASWPDHVFRVGLDASAAMLHDPSGGLYQDFTPSAAVNTSSVTLIAPAEPPAGTDWPYVSPSSAPVYTLAGAEGSGLYSDDRTYVAATDGYLRAIKGDGSLLWEFAASPLSPIYSSPTDSQLESGSAYIYFANDNGDVYKVRDDGASASQVWKRSLGVQIRSSIIVSGDRLYFGAADNKMHCIDKTSADGSDCDGWSDLAVEGTVSGVPMVDDRTGVNMTWVGTEEGTLVSMNTGSGLYGNSMDTLGPVRTSPFGDTGWADSSNKLYLTSTDGKLYTATMDLNNSDQPFNAGSAIYSSPFLWTFSGTKYVFFGDDAGRMHKVSTQTWSEPAGWPFQAGGAIRSSPVVVPYSYVGLGVGEDYVYFGCDDGYIYAVNINTGQLRTGWPVATGGPVRADPVINAGPVLTVGSTDGRTYTIYIGP